MSTPLTLYPVNSASAVLPNAALLLSASGSATTLTPTTLVGTSTGWGEIAFAGNAGPWAAAGSEPNPTGYGACFDGLSLVAQQILAGNWSAMPGKLFSNASGVSFSLDHLKLRFWKYTASSATYTAIGSIDLGTQTITNTSTSFSFPSTAEPVMNFVSGDYLYIDQVAHITSSTGATATSKIKMTIGGASTTQGNATFTIVSPGFQPTPVLAVTSSTLNFSATAGGANPASQPDTLSETSGTGTAWTSAIVYGSGSGWLAISPTSDTLAGSGSETVTFSCTTGALAAGTYTATVTFTATTGGNTVAVTVTFTVNPGGTLVSSDSPYAMTRYVNGNNKQALSYDSIALFASFTQGGTIPFYVRYQYSWNYIETAKGVYGGFGPLDETVDKMMATPGLRFIFNLAYAPNWWQIIDASGNNTGTYGSATAVLPDGPAMAKFATVVTNRYQSFINSGRIILQIGNEEYDTALAGSIGGKILAPTFNYVAQAILSIAPNAIIIAGCIRPGAHPNGAGTQQWMTNFYSYVPKTGEPPQAIPFAHDFHFYDDSAVVTSAGYPAPDPTVTDNSSNYLAATKVPVQGVISIMQNVLNTYNSNAQIWNLENGYSLPNESPNNHNSSPTDLPSQQSRYTRNMMAQLQYANVGGKYAFYSVLNNGNDPRALNGQAITDFTNYVIARPQWTGAAVPTQYLYTSVDAFSFEGTSAQKPPDQYFSIMNPTSTANVAWSLSSNKTWLSASTLPLNGKGGTGGGATNGTLAVGQCITLKCTADSTQNGLTQLSALTGTLTITIGGTDYPITVSLFVAPTAANPNITSNSAGPGNGPLFTMAVNAAPPAPQSITFTNQDAYATWWYAFTTANWFTIDVSSGNLATNANQAINITMGSTVSNFAPGTYHEVVTISATPFPVPYTTVNIPAQTQFITVDVKLTVQVAHTPTIAVQVSTPTLLFQAVASGSLPASQTFFLLNCTNAAKAWTAAKTQTWLTLSQTSSTTNLPASGSDNGVTSPNQQATDYFVITASINTTSLAAGTYSDTITVTLGGSATQTIAVTYVVSGTGSTLTIGAVPSPNPFSLSQSIGGANVSGTVTLTNSGTATGTYKSTIAYTNGSGWIASITPSKGTLTGGGGQQIVTITLATGSLAAGTYTANITFTLGTSTAIVAVTFTITAVTSGATFSASPTALPFSAIVNGANPAPQQLSISNTGGSSGTWSATITYTNGGNNQGWLTLSPLSGQLAVGASQQVSVFADDTGLAAGTYTATVSIGTVVVSIAFIISAPAPALGGALSNLLSLAVQKTQVVKVYDASGNYLGIWRDAPLLTGLKSTMNAADSQIKMVLPRKIDAFGGAGQPGTDNTVVLENTVQIWLYGPGLPSTGLLKFNGVIDTIEPTIDASNAETVTVTLTPYGSIVADHGYPGSITLSNVDPIQLFTYWFLNNDSIPGLGRVPYADPLTLSSASASSSGLSVTYAIQNLNLKSTFDVMMQMLGNGWFWRVDPDLSARVSRLSPTAQHTLLLGQHLSSFSGLVDNNQRKNVIDFVGASGISAIAVGASAKPKSQGGIGERIAYYQDSRITDNNSASIIAQGLLSLLDQPLVRTKCRIFDYRGDVRTRLGYDIESILVGDTVTIKDARTTGVQSTYGTSRYGQAEYGQSPGVVFNSVVPVLSIDYNWSYIDIECGTFQPSQDRSLFNIRQKLQDFTVGQP